MALVGAVAAACGDDKADTAVTDAGVPDATPVPGYVPESPQRAGDAAAGYTALVNAGYVRCGVPYTAYASVFPPASPSNQIEGRTGRNATLPYNFTAFTADDGVEAVAPNCLQCHADTFDGQVVIGLGNTHADYTEDTAVTAGFACNLLSDAAEIAHCQKWIERLRAIGPYIQTATVGVNPADNLAAALFAHRDQDTLAWSNEPLLELPPEITVPVDVPPWWRMNKKHAMFYNAAGRGDHARIMMTASALCTDTIAEAEAIDSYFPDVHAYVAALEPPPYPREVDNALAERGRTVFEATCARCHGTYASNGDDTYPNLLIDLAEIGTDDTLVLGTNQFAGRFVEWFNGSFYGELGALEPQNGYVAPPLDGVWITSPFLHNGSVPTIAALLDSTTRPTYWRRSFDRSDYDYERLGWNYETLETGHADEPSASKRKLIYDTTQLGYGNGGHTFGDDLSEADRTAVIEYLKTL